MSGEHSKGFGGPKRPADAAVAATPRQTGLDHGVDRVGAAGRARVRGRRQPSPAGGGHALAPERHPVERPQISDLLRHHHAQAGLVIGFKGDVQQLQVERRDRQHVLQRGNAIADRFRRRQQRARADLFGAALRIGGRQRVGETDLGRQVLEAAAQQDVVGVVVGVDEAGDQQLAVGVDRPRPCRRDAVADFGDASGGDADIGAQRPVGVALMVVHKRPADDEVPRGGHGGGAAPDEGCPSARLRCRRNPRGPARRPVSNVRARRDTEAPACGA